MPQTAKGGDETADSARTTILNGSTDRDLRKAPFFWFKIYRRKPYEEYEQGILESYEESQVKARDMMQEINLVFYKQR